MNKTGKISIILFIIFATILFLLSNKKYKKNKVEFFKMLLEPKYKSKLTESCYCNDKNHYTELVNFIDYYYNILESYKIENAFEIESSTKFEENSINSNRISTFISFKLLKDHPELINALLDCHKSQNSEESPSDENTNMIESNCKFNESYISQIKSLLNEKMNTQNTHGEDIDGQLVLGNDYQNKLFRIYINYIKENVKYIDSYEYDKTKMFSKRYVSLPNINVALLNKLKYLFGKDMLNLFIDAFPLKTWETVLERKDNKLENPSYYVCFHFDPMVENIYHKLNPLINYVYGKAISNKWYKCNSDNHISWISFGANKQNKKYLTIYLVRNSNNRQDLEKLFLYLNTESGNIIGRNRVN